jgi:hypothetical protein
VKRRIAAILAALLDRTCDLSGHWAACGLLNSRIRLGYDEATDAYRIDLPSPTYRLYWWAILNLDD